MTVETADGTDQRVNVEQVEKIIIQAEKIAAAGSDEADFRRRGARVAAIGLGDTNLQ